MISTSLLAGLLVVVIVGAALWTMVRRRASRIEARPGGESPDADPISATPRILGLTDPSAEPRATATSRTGHLLGLDPPEPPRGSVLLFRRVRWGLAAGVLAVATALVVGIQLFSTQGGSNEAAAGRSPVTAEVADPARSELASVASRSRPVEPEIAVDPVHGTRLMAWSGSGQAGEPGRPLHRGLAVVLQDSAGRPMPGAEVRFTVAGGGGRIEPSQVTTSDLGLAVTTWWLGSDPDSLRVTAHLVSTPGLRVDFSATFSDGAGPERVVAEAPAPVVEEADPIDVSADAPRAAAQVPARAPAASASAPAAERPRRVAVRTRAGFSAGGVHTCRLVAGEVRCWGGDEGGPNDRSRTGTPPGAPALRAVSAGVFHSCGVTGRGSVYCWAVRGSAPSVLSASPIELELPRGGSAVEVVAGAEHSCALSSDGDVYCWGSNAHGQIGDGTTSDASSPVRVEGLPRVTQLASGWMHTCALTAAGRAYCWGANGSGQIGDGGSGVRTRPTHVDHAGAFTHLTAGSAHSCALTATGRVWCWGSNDHGQLGTGATAGERRPRAVVGDQLFRTVAAGGVHTCGVTEDGAAWCWGRNTFGQLGNETVRDSNRPALVAGGRRLVALEAGGSHTCGETVEGGVYCWGNNVQGQVGDGTRDNRNVPVAVVQEE